VFSTDTFKAWAKKNVILVEVDSPRRTQLPDDLKKQNEELKRKFSIRGFPTILFLDGNEKVIGKSGYRPGGPKKWIEDAAKQIK
jgi:protein disulfide-isomerase